MSRKLQRSDGPAGPRVQSLATLVPHREQMRRTITSLARGSADPLDIELPEEARAEVPPRMGWFGFGGAGDSVQPALRLPFDEQDRVTVRFLSIASMLCRSLYVVSALQQAQHRSIDGAGVL